MFSPINASGLVIRYHGRQWGTQEND
jgi:hypothetical protein